MIFVDSNIPMYLVGADHPYKRATLHVLRELVRDEERLVTSAEVLQEILHRYGAIDRRDAIQPSFKLLLGLTDEVFPVTVDDVLRAREIVLEDVRLSARDGIHLAVMEAHGVHRILSFDSGFDRWPNVERLQA